MIVFDLEWNNGRGELVFDEIIQIGAVKFDLAAGKITDRINLYIHPSVQKSYSKAAKKLPDLSKSLESELTFTDAAAVFFDWCGDDNEFGTWGNCDMPVLAQNLNYWKVDKKLPKKYTDIQKAFCRMVGARDQIALGAASEYCGFPDSLTFHDALTDAAYTAFVATVTDKSQLKSAVFSYRVPDVYRRSCKVRDRDRLMQDGFGPYDTESEIFSNEEVRTGFCPVCRAKAQTKTWHGADETTFYGAFECQNHGAFYAELIICLYQDDDKFACERSILEGTDENAYIYRRSKKSVVDCKSEKKRKKRRRRRKAKKPEPQPEAV